jgi:hypothetical protein
MNRINWNHLIELNIQDNIINNIKSYFHKRIDDKKLIWLNTVFNDIFIYQIFVDEINNSGYLMLDMENRRVVRKMLNVDAEEFIPHSDINITNVEFIPHSGGLNINAEEFTPRSAINIATAEFIPRSAINITNAEFIPRSAINIANAEFIPQNDNMELLVNSMLGDLIN